MRFHTLNLTLKLYILFAGGEKYREPQFWRWPAQSLPLLSYFSAPSPARCQLRALHLSPFGPRAVPFSSLSQNFRPSFPSRPLQLVIIQSRTITLGSLFSSKPSPTPSPHAVAHVAKIEADANAHPYDVCPGRSPVNLAIAPSRDCAAQAET